MTRFCSTVVLALALLFVTGCSSVTETFPDHSPEQVWTALTAVAETPDYRDPDPAKEWFVKENHVWVDEAAGQIEIYREIDRILHRAGTRPERQFRSLKLQVLFEAHPVPTATMTARHADIPTRAQAEMARYFDDVRELLNGSQMLSGPDDEPAPAPAPDPQPVDPAAPVDIEALEPDDG